MPNFSATYTTRAGQTRQLRLQATDAASARRDLRRRGIVPSALELVESNSSRPRSGPANRNPAAPGSPAGSGTPATTVFGLDLSGLLEARPGIREKALFANKLAALVDAGVPIVRSLDLMARQQRMPLFKRALTAVSTDVNQGGSLGAALRRWPKVFDKLTIAMVEAGEAGGVLDESLRRLAKLLEGNAKLQNQIKGAMGYPVAVLVIAVLVFLGMTIFLIPTFAGIFEDLGAELPLFTQLMVDLSKLLRSSFSLLLVMALVVGGWLFSRYYATADGRRRVDGLLLQLPLFGDLIQKTATAKFCRTFSSLTRAGVPILLSLEIVQETAGNAVIAEAIVASRQDVQEGIPLSVALGRKQVFPELALSMLAIGEETGQMDTMLSKVADFYEDEVEAAVKALTSMLEPAMIVIVGGIVGSILLAMYLPMFSIFDQIK
ncbi:type II secretion system F family protein [Vulcanococcus sp. Clear-D1]|uniref:type II secretion system F family protein n=1 Tax=Vulcanococcus sp. Clear-D1 TaxID=2766970 RepID=UPI0019BD592A|nr:type II secretion system F family protein [Vulcanococcus sp. Clear-D1]MBD1193890.1 type II secretion system F family protein [Vulcanococcus sp. Clear-D1]